MSIAEARPAQPEEEVQVLYTDWSGYLKVLDLIGEGPTRATYDQGKLELRVPSERHESESGLLELMLVCLLEETGRDFQTGGATTLRKQDLARGLEPGRCFWIDHCWRDEQHTDYDPDTDPPPDLAVEVEVSRSSIDRMGIYRALGVPEVWRWSEAGLRVHRLDAEGHYDTCPSSPTFPGIPLGEVERFLRQGRGQITSRVLRDFRAWVRQRLAGS